MAARRRRIQPHAFLVGTYLSHTGTAFFGTHAYYVLVCSGRWRHLWLTLLAGAALGMTFLSRELSALLIALPLTVYLVLPGSVARVRLAYARYWPGGVLPIIVIYGLHLATRDTVWALAMSTQFSQLSAAFPHRTLYLLTSDRTTMTFKPWRG